MGSALAFKHEKKKKGKASPKSEDSRESHPWEDADAREGLPLFLQCNMAVGAPEDEFEREANRVADTVEAVAHGCRSGQTGFTEGPERLRTCRR